MVTGRNSLRIVAVLGRFQPGYQVECGWLLVGIPYTLWLFWGVFSPFFGWILGGYWPETAEKM